MSLAVMHLLTEREESLHRSTVLKIKIQKSREWDAKKGMRTLRYARLRRRS